MNMKDPRSYYQTVTERNSHELSRWQRRRNAVTVLRVAVFGLLVWDVYGIAALDSRIWIWTALATLAAFVVLGILDSRVVRRISYCEELARCCRNEQGALEDDFGELPTGAEFADPGHAYSADLDIFGADSLFRRINRTVTPGGKRTLAEWLLTPCREAGEIRARQQGAGELAGMPDWCLRFRVMGALGRKKKREGPDGKAWERFLAEPALFGATLWRWIPGLLTGVTVAAWVCVIAVGSGFVWSAVILSLLQLAIVGSYAKRVGCMQARLEAFLGVMGSYAGVVRMLSEANFSAERLKELRGAVAGNGADALRAFRELGRLMDGLEQRANLIAVLVTNALWMRDVRLVMRLEKWRRLYGGRVGEWLGSVAVADTLVSMAGFRFNHPEYVVPQITDEVLLEARGVGHPMLSRGGCVTNDLVVRDLHEFYIVTGANMAGKSTFLRTVGVSLVLALSGNTVCAAEFRCRPMALFTSMRTTDNLSEGTSYFHAELLRLQELVRTAEQEERLFIILDEMLKGTNSQDKLNGSLRFLEKLLSYRVAGLVATHDLALGELQDRFPDNFRNVCFEIDHRGREIVYDYKLHPGVSRNMNATILLEQMGLI